MVWISAYFANLYVMVVDVCHYWSSNICGIDKTLSELPKWSGTNDGRHVEVFPFFLFEIMHC